MRIEKIIEVLRNQVKRETKGNIVLHKTITPQSISAYSKVEYKLYYILAKKKHLLLSYNDTLRVLVGQEESVLKGTDLIFLDRLMDYIINSTEWKKLLTGELDEQIKA